MIQNEQQYIITRREWTKFNEAILRLQRTPVSRVAKQLGYTDAPEGDLAGFLLGELELNALTSQRDDLAAEMDEYDRRVNGDRKGTWMTLFTGVRFWPEDPRPQDIDIRDIAHALAAINRFGGHTREPYSVAQHCVLGSYVILPRLALPFLMHDAGECYLGDVITPLKRLFREFYEPAEEKVMQAVASRFGFDLDWTTRAVVKQVDLVMLATELRDLTPAGVTNQPLTELPLEEQILRYWSAEEAERRFLERFEELMRARTTEYRQAV